MVHLLQVVLLETLATFKNIHEYIRTLHLSPHCNRAEICIYRCGLSAWLPIYA